MNIKLRYFLFITAFIVSCSKGTDSVNSTPIPTPLPPPGKAPNSKITSNGIGALTGQTAIFEASQSLGGKSGLAKQIFALAANAIPSEAKQATKGKVTRIQDAVTSGKCRIDSVRPPDKIDSSHGAAAFFPRMKVIISGPNCPMEVTLDLNLVGESSDTHDICKDSSDVKVCKFTGHMDMTYRILDENFSADLQVKNGEMKMLFKVEQTYPGGSSSSSRRPSSMVMKGKTEFEFKAFETKGQTHIVTGSQNFDVSMALPTSGTPNGASPMVATATENVQYLDQVQQTSSNFSASININANSSQETYTIDGAAVTAEVYSAERDKFANSMLAFGKKNSNGHSEPPNPIPNPGRPPGQIPPPPGNPQP